MVIELDVLILLFLGWQQLAAELIGRIVLIAVSSILIRITYPKVWVREAKEKVADETDAEEDFDCRQRLRSFDGCW